MATTLWDGTVLGGWSPQPPSEADANSPEPTRPEHTHLLISAEAQAGALGEIVAWAGVAIWGGALVSFVARDIARSYRHNRPVLHKPARHRPGQRQDAR